LYFPLKKVKIMRYSNLVFFFILLQLSFFSCKEKNSLIDKEEGINVKNELFKDTIYKLTDSKVNSEGVFIFNSGTEILMNWTEWSKESNKNILKFSFFDTISQKFMKPISIPPSKGLQMHAESMAKVGVTAEGVLYAIFRLKSKSRKTMYGGTMYYTISADKGKTWSDKIKLVADESSDSQSFYDISILPDGEIGITWLDSRKPIHKNNKGKTLYFAKTNTDKGFYKEIPIAGSTCECCRTDIYIDKNKKIHVAYRNIIEKTEDFSNTNFTLSDVEIRDMYYVSSDDNGKTFSKPIPISNDNWHMNGCPHTGPSLAQKGSDLAAVWFTAANNTKGIFFTTKNNGKFNERKLLSAEGRHPQMIEAVGKYFVVYEMYYELEDIGYTKIVLEEIKSSIKDKIKREVSDLKTNNNHAVISSINDSTILIAWINKNTRNPRLVYKLMSNTNLNI